MATNISFRKVSRFFNSCADSINYLFSKKMDIMLSYNFITILVEGDVYWRSAWYNKEGALDEIFILEQEGLRISKRTQEAYLYLKHQVYYYTNC